MPRAGAASAGCEAAAADYRPLDGAEIESHVAALDTQGYTKIEDFVAPHRVAELRKLLTQQLDALGDANYPGYSELRPDDKQVFNLQNKDARFLDPLSAPAIERILMAKLNDPYYPAIPADAPNYILGEYIARASGRPLRMHIDAWMPAPGPNTWMMQLAVALDDRDEANGCTTVVPGSHLSGAYSDRDYPNPVTLPAKAGDVMLWDSRLWHGALANRTDRKAWALVATLQRWWVKPRFDITAGLPAAVYARLGERQRALLGFCAQPPRDETQGTNTRQGYDVLPAALTEAF